MSTVTVENVTKTFGDTVAVDDFFLEVADREFVVLLGPSGCGKTTTLNMIAGLDTPSAGAIHIGGQRVDHLPADRRDISMVFQSIALYPHMSAYRNIAFPLKMAKKPKPEINERVRAAAALLRIEPLLDRKPYQLSGGERQRVALGRAVVRDPSVFLFDEPLSSLDAKLRVEMRVEIKTLHQRLGATFVYVTHDQVEAMTMADRIAVMDGGRLLQVGRPTEIYERPVNLMVAGFVGSPPMNFVTGEVRQAGNAFRFESESFALALPATAEAAVRTLDARAVTLGVRPERIGIDGADGTVEGWIFATEPVGSDLFLDVAFGDAEQADPILMKVRTLPEAAIKVRDPVRLSLPSQHLFLFDESGRRVHPV